MTPPIYSRNLILILLLLFFPVVALAQIGSAQSQVNIIIAQVQSIQVTQPNVSINMNQVSHYKNGNSSGQQSNHVKVSTSTGYQVTVKASTQYFSHNGSNSTVPVNTITLQTAVGNDLTNSNAAPPAGLTVTPQTVLSTSPSTIVSSPSGEWSRGFHVNYTIPANKANEYMDIDSGTYTTTVTYTLVPQ